MNDQPEMHDTSYSSASSKVTINYALTLVAHVNLTLLVESSSRFLFSEEILPGMTRVGIVKISRKFFDYLGAVDEV